MGEYLRWAALVLTGLILSLTLSKQAKDFSVLLTLAVCTLVCIGAMEFLKPVTQLLHQLQQLADLDSDALNILLKCALIGVISELAGVLCSDAGEGALGKALLICSNAAILWLIVPLVQQILTLIGEVLAKT